MIVSYLHNFIFIKTRKTAGSSLEIALATHAGPDDVVTPLGAAEEVERFRDHPDILPRNFSSDKEAESRFAAALREEDRRTMKTILREDMRDADKLIFERHGSARTARQGVGEEFWNLAYKFSIERHPYEKAVSLAWYQRHRQNFDVALKNVLQNRLYRNFDLYTLDGAPAMDFIIRYERLAEDIQRVEEAIGVPVFSRMPRSNSRQRKDSRSAKEMLTDQQKAIVQETCREEFELFGYER